MGWCCCSSLRTSCCQRCSVKKNEGGTCSR
jgi:hypothetical protein